MMADIDREPNSNTTYEQHPLYQAAMKRMAAGDQEGMIEKLRRLANLYPKEQALQDLLVRTELRTTLATSGPVVAERSGPTPFLRRAVLFMLVLTIGLAIVVGFGAAYNRIVSPARDNKEEELHIEALKQEAQQRLASGDWSGAQQVLKEVLTIVPSDPTAQAGIALSQQQMELDRLYTDALAAQQQGDVQTALDRLRQIQAEDPAYRDVQQRIDAMQKVESLQTTWLEAQDRIQAGDWPGAVSLLTQIRAQNPSFNRTEVEEQLYQAYAQLARLQIAQANGNLDMLRQAVGYMDQALALKPTSQELVEERRLAAGYVDGFDAYNREDWIGAASQWEPVYTAQPDYQGGTLRDVLYQAYPKAAKSLIAQANGSAVTLRQAIGYLDQALAIQPDNPELVEERRLAAEYVAGAEASAQQSWQEAMNHWGPIYAARPNYQNGVLEKNLRQACANSPAPNTTYCPP
jgi:outer membrane protein assembly factor BamD (BamD/ComL family)